MHELFADLGPASLYTLLAFVLGIAVFGISIIWIPKLVEHFTPHIDEQKEIARGNQAVAEYHGRIVSACIVGMSIIIAAAIVAGLR